LITAGPFELVYDPSVGENEPWYINDHTFFSDRSGTWHLIGITHAEPFKPFEELDLAHATAPALHGPWTKQRYAMSTDPAWGETHLWAPHVMEHDDRYWMFVCAGGASGDKYRIHLATSDDGFEWTRHPANPLIVDGYHARDPMVFRHEDRWLLYYTVTTEPSGGNHAVAVAKSDDLVTWNGRRLVYVDELAGAGGGPTESPFVVERNGIYYLFIGPAPGKYRKTRIFASDDPLHFEEQVGTVNAHAAEVITDIDGSTWVSHCGWGQGGVYLASLTFEQ
jgi:beta-fructofuranosidase